MELSELLEFYRTISLEMAEKIRNQEDISLLLNKRQEIIAKINEGNFSREEICTYLKDFNIIEIDDELQKKLKEQMTVVKKEIKRIKQSKMAYNKYADFNASAAIFSTKR